MRKEIKGFNKYWLEDGKVIHKRTGHIVKVNKDNCVQLIKDNCSINTTIGLNKIIRLADQNFKTYLDIQKERNVKYKPVYGNKKYLFCEDVEDELKIWSIQNQQFITPCYNDNHLRYALSRKTVFYYKIVWEYYNQKHLRKGLVIHHRDGHPENNIIDNLIPLTNSQHTQLHHDQKTKAINSLRMRERN